MDPLWTPTGSAVVGAGPEKKRKEKRRGAMWIPSDPLWTPCGPLWTPTVVGAGPNEEAKSRQTTGLGGGRKKRKKKKRSKKKKKKKKKKTKKKKKKK